MSQLNDFSEFVDDLGLIITQMIGHPSDRDLVTRLITKYENAIEQLVLDNESSMAAHAQAVAEYDNAHDLEMRELI